MWPVQHMPGRALKALFFFYLDNRGPGLLGFTLVSVINLLLPFLCAENHDFIVQIIWPNWLISFISKNRVRPLPTGIKHVHVCLLQRWVLSWYRAAASQTIRKTSCFVTSSVAMYGFVFFLQKNQNAQDVFQRPGRDWFFGPSASGSGPLVASDKMKNDHSIK